MSEMSASDIKKIRNIFVKISNFFKNEVIMTNDGYIFDIKSDLALEANIGQYAVKLDDKLVELFNQFIGEEYTMIELIPSKMKDDLTEFQIIEEDGRSFYYDVMKRVRTRICDFDNRAEYPDSRCKYISEIDDTFYDDIFKDGKSRKIGGTEKDNPSVVVSKSIFPCITKKNYPVTKYYTTTAHDVTFVLTIFTKIDGLNIQMCYYYIR